MYWIILFIESCTISTLMYLFLHKKARVNLKYLYLDNIAVIFITWFSVILLLSFVELPLAGVIIFIIPLLIVSLGFGITMIRFWRTPKREIHAKKNEIVSPADGNVIYIKKIEQNNIPISVKNGEISSLKELIKTDLIKQPCWLIGINMTPFDVHKNCAPIDGEIILNKHTKGKFFSLKVIESEVENERNTIIIKNDKIQVGFTQIASRLVRKIAVYKKEGMYVQKGDWLGMIRFGSQVDVIIPINCDIKVNLKEQIYAGKTILASFSYEDIN